MVDFLKSTLLTIFINISLWLLLRMYLEFGLRKVQIINGSQFVSLLRVWTRTNKIEKGDSVRIDLLEDGSLKILPYLGGK